MADQITTVSKRRLLRRLGSLSVSDFAVVQRVIKIQLGLWALFGTAFASRPNC